jgi:hypothetical protein
MKRLRYLVFPALSVLLYVLGWKLGGPAIVDYFGGIRTRGRVVALVRLRGTERDVILDVVRRVQIARADGSRIEAEFAEGELRGFVERRGGAVREWGAEDLARPSGGAGGTNGATAGAADRAAIDAVRPFAAWTADDVKRFLQRESARKDAARAARVDWSETVRLLGPLEGEVESVEVAGGRVAAVVAGGRRIAADAASDVRTDLAFEDIRGTDRARELKSPVATSGTRTVGGGPPSEAADSLLRDRDFRRVFRPVYAFEADGAVRVHFADLAARMAPPPNFGLYQSVLVVYPLGRPERARLAPDFGTLAGRSPLDRLNQFLSVLFGRWYLPLLCWLVATVYALMSLLLLSLHVRPGRTETADVRE